jgi:predicted AlkP superfamily pyrophosphatase or phosphodiesterase
MQKKRLIMIQIDGLSRNQFLKACNSGRMPFVKSLLSRYVATSFYSGIPSSTPAVQAELFYGVPGAVPSFGFLDRRSKKPTSMLVGATARRVELELEKKSPGLILGGSTYSDNYTAMANKSRFCVTKLGTAEFWKKGIVHIVKSFLFHWVIALRVVGLFIVETVLALIDSVHGIIGKEDILSEIKFVPSRIGICVILRELIVSFVCKDIRNGVEMIHCNFLGYDEQSHRRGPSSRFAHWTLRGIDNAIRRIYTSAKKYELNNYSLWIYSDHGQENVVSYSTLYKNSIHDAVLDIIRTNFNVKENKHLTDRGIQFQRAALLKDKADPVVFKNNKGNDVCEKDVEVVCTGPVGHIYMSSSLPFPEKERIAQLLVEKAHVPIVLFTDIIENVIAYTIKGRFEIPEKLSAVIGEGSPFIEEIKMDIVRIIHHPDSGEFVLLGWRFDANPITFPRENGAHAGPGMEETHAFALFPENIKIMHHEKGYIRPGDLRKTVLNYLKDEDAAR